VKAAEPAAPGNANINKHRARLWRRNAAASNGRRTRWKKNRDVARAVSRFHAFVRVKLPLHFCHSTLLFPVFSHNSSLSPLFFITFYLLSCLSATSRRRQGHLFPFLLMFCTSVASGRRPSTAPSVLIHVYSNAFSVSSSSSNRHSGHVRSLTACHISLESPTDAPLRLPYNTKALNQRRSTPDGRQTESWHGAVQRWRQCLARRSVRILTFRTNAIAEPNRRRYTRCRPAPVSM